MHRHSSAADRRAFTLLEIIIAVVLVGILVSISIRSVSNTIRKDRVNKAAAILGSDVEQAFAAAARQRLPVRLLIDTSTAYRTFAVADRADTTFKYRSRQFASGDLQLDFVRSNTLALDIFPSGLSADTLSLRLGIRTGPGTTYSRTLRVSRGGLVRVK